MVIFKEYMRQKSGKCGVYEIKTYPESNRWNNRASFKQIGAF